jgi:hypothetical protein
MNSTELKIARELLDQGSIPWNYNVSDGDDIAVVAFDNVYRDLDQLRKEIEFRVGLSNYTITLTETSALKIREIQQRFLTGSGLYLSAQELIEIALLRMKDEMLP